MASRFTRPWCQVSATRMRYPMAAQKREEAKPISQAIYQNGREQCRPLRGAPVGET